jgi:hypothetical protein
VAGQGTTNTTEVQIYQRLGGVRLIDQLLAEKQQLEADLAQALARGARLAGYAEFPILGLSRPFTKREADVIFRALAAIFHPDQQGADAAAEPGARRGAEGGAADGRTESPSSAAATKRESTMSENIEQKLAAFFRVMWGYFIDDATIDGADLQTALERSGLTVWREATAQDAERSDYIEEGDSILCPNDEGKAIIRGEHPR